MRGIAFDRLDEIGNQVGAAAELDGDSAEAFFDQRAQAHQSVVENDRVEQQQAASDDDDPAFKCHGIAPFAVALPRA